MNSSTKKPDKLKSSSIILDLSIKNALEKRAQVNPNHEVILPWWFKRNVEDVLSHERLQALQWLMLWLHHNAPEEAEHVYSESDGSQNIVINPMVILDQEVQAAFIEAGFKLMTEDDVPDTDKADVWERILKGSDFSDQWH